MVRTTTMLWTGFFLAAIGACAGACAGGHGRNEDLDAAAAALVSDNDKTEEAEQDVEASLEVPLSGATSEDTPVDTTSDSSAVDAAVANSGKYFAPAGCIQSTRSGNVITHLFNDCTGPYGCIHMIGTVTSTWTKTTSGVQVVQSTQGFKLNGAVVDHTATIAYTYENGIYTLHRTGTTAGTTADGLPIRHEASYATTWEPQGRCVTRNGSSDTTIENREFSRQIEGYERCGTGLLGCPNAGTFTLRRPRLDVQIHFDGGRSYDLVLNGRTFSNRAIAWCIPS